MVLRLATAFYSVYQRPLTAWQHWEHGTKIMLLMSENVITGMLMSLAYIHKRKKILNLLHFRNSRLNHAHTIYGGSQVSKTGSWQRRHRIDLYYCLAKVEASTLLNTCSLYLQGIVVRNRQVTLIVANSRKFAFEQNRASAASLTFTARQYPSQVAFFRVHRFTCS